MGRRYFVDKTQACNFLDFKSRVRCTLANAIKMVREASKKNHVCISVDEIWRVAMEGTVGGRIMSPLQELIKSLVPFLDGVGEYRVNFVFSSLATVP
jgi:hypothetical protein